MNTFQIIILAGFFGSTILGLLVVLSNPEKRLNRYFLVTTGLIIFWLFCMFMITLQPSDSPSFSFWTRQVSAAAGLLPLGFFILKHVILKPEVTILGLCCKLRYLLVSSFLVCILCQTHFFMRLAYFSSPEDTVPLGDYGPGFILYIAYFVFTMPIRLTPKGTTCSV